MTIIGISTIIKVLSCLYHFFFFPFQLLTCQHFLLGLELFKRKVLTDMNVILNLTLFVLVLHTSSHLIIDITGVGFIKRLLRIHLNKLFSKSRIYHECAFMKNPWLVNVYGKPFFNIYYILYFITV